MENAQHRHNISGGGWELLEPHLMYKNNQQSFTGGICRARPYRRRPDIPRREWRPGRETGRSEASVRHPVGVQSRGIFFESRYSRLRSGSLGHVFPFSNGVSYG